MSITIGRANSMTALLESPIRPRDGTEKFGLIACEKNSIDTEPGSISSRNASGKIGQPDNNDAVRRGYRTIPRLAPQALHPLPDVEPQADVVSPSQEQLPTETGTTTGAGSGTDPSRKVVAVDFVHVELPNGVKFDLRHLPGAGETSEQALQSLLKAVEELSKELGGIAIPAATDKDATAHSEDGSSSAYGKQSSAYSSRLPREGTDLTV